jgi:hypothetical protein
MATRRFQTTTPPKFRALTIISMKIAELAAIPANLTGDFHAAESHLLDLDKHMTLRTYLDGYTLSEIDEKIWVGLASNRATMTFIRKGKLANLTRWFLYVEQAHHEIQKDVKEAQAAAAAMLAAASKAGGSYSLQPPKCRSESVHQIPTRTFRISSHRTREGST